MLIKRESIKASNLDFSEFQVYFSFSFIFRINKKKWFLYNIKNQPFIYDFRI